MVVVLEKHDALDSRLSSGCDGIRVGRFRQAPRVRVRVIEQAEPELDAQNVGDGVIDNVEIDPADVDECLEVFRVRIAVHFHVDART